MLIRQHGVCLLYPRCGALQDELLEYFRLISVLEGQLGTDAYDADGVTLRRLVVWTQEPLQRMRMLAIIVDQCKPVMGGGCTQTALACAVGRLDEHPFAAPRIPSFPAPGCTVGV